MVESTSIQQALRGLRSSDPDDAGRAADALYRSATAAQSVADKDIGDALRHSVALGHLTASAILLLGYLPGAEELLKKLARESGDARLKLHPWTDIVPLRLAARAALSRLGDRQEREALLQSIPELDTAGRLFLLDIIAYIDAPEVWQALSDTMKDTREIRVDVPSGAPRRRVCDHAADAFLDRFGFKVSFERKPGGRYAPSEIEEIQRALHNSIPQ